MRRLLLGGLVLVFAVLVSGAFGGSRPSLCHVSGAGNNDYGSLQDAVNASSAGDSLKVKGTCVGSTVVDRSLAISGHGAEATLDGGMLGTVLRIQEGVTLKLTRLTITHGADTSTDGDGGGVRNLGTLTVKDSVVTDNRSGNGAGAGIYNAGDLTVTDSTISHNRAGYFGGGLYNVLGATAALRRTSVSDNTANIGGGIYNPGPACGPRRLPGGRQPNSRGPRRDPEYRRAHRDPVQHPQQLLRSKLAGWRHRDRGRHRNPQRVRGNRQPGGEWRRGQRRSRYDLDAERHPRRRQLRDIRRWRDQKPRHRHPPRQQHGHP